MANQILVFLKLSNDGDVANPFIALQLIDNLDGTFSIFLAEQSNSDAPAIASQITGTGLPLLAAVAAAIAIGATVTGGAPNAVLFVDPGGLLADDAQFTYDPTSNLLEVVNLNINAGSISGVSADTRIIYNNGGVLAGDAALTWDDTAQTLRIGGTTLAAITGGLLVEKTLAAGAQIVGFYNNITSTKIGAVASMVGMANDLTITNNTAKNFTNLTGESSNIVVTGQNTTITNCIAQAYSVTLVGATAAIGKMVGATATLTSVANPATINESIGFEVAQPLYNVGTTVTNNYGLLIRTQVHAGGGIVTNRWGFYIVGAAVNSQIEGSLILGPSGLLPGTNGAQVFTQGNGTAPTTQPANSVQRWVDDFAAGDARLRVLSEIGGRITLGNNLIGFATGTSDDTFLGRQAAGVAAAIGSGGLPTSPLCSFVANFLVVADPDGRTVANTEGRTVFTNEGATALDVFNLPPAVAGLSYTFIVQDADGIEVRAAAGDTIRLDATVSAAAGATTSTTIGSVVTLVAINATEWIAISIVGTWVTA